VNSTTLKRTPLFGVHQRLGGKLIDFGGWEMPVQYTGIMDEHLAVRNAAGVFDISHMGEIHVHGPSAEAFLNQTLTNDVRKLEAGQGQYTLLCNERGGVIDDLYVYRLAASDYLLIINASRIETYAAWFERRREEFAAPDLRVKNLSDATGAIAVQGPRVAEFIDRCFEGPATAGTAVSRPSELKKNQIARFRSPSKANPQAGAEWEFGPAGEAWVSRTGYTGEEGFEAVAPAGNIEEIWEQVSAVGKSHGIKPAGLGARDTLRTEVCYPLYGHELDENTTPIEAGLSFFVGLDKGEFVGRSVLAAQKAAGPGKKLVAFKMTEKSAPPRPHYAIWSTGANATRIGQVVSGTQSPSLGVGIGLGYVPPEFSKAQTPIEIEIRGKRAAAVVVPKPIYRKTEKATP